MNRIALLAMGLAAAIAFATGCAATHQSTTARTGVEQALLTETARQAVNEMQVPPMDGKAYAIKPEGFEAVEKAFVLSSLSEKLLKAGGRLPQGDAKPDVDVEPRTNYAQIDQGVFLVGLPSIPIPVPGAGVVQSPELAIFKKDTQKARTKFSAFGVNKSDGSLAFATESPASKRYYTRWTILFIFNFKSSNLGKPF